VEALTITQLGLDDADALGVFFEALASDAETTRFFHPHPLTRAFAQELCSRLSQGQDRYYALWDGDTIIGYAMLRGWDAGYEAPSFGVCLAPGRRQEGLGQRLTRHAIAECRRLGARRLRLTVYRGNERAVHIYRKLGFVFTAKNAEELVGLLEL
jgi:ribosomal protein S18 acetylase RimI-like enzyme